MCFLVALLIVTAAVVVVATSVNGQEPYGITHFFSNRLDTALSPDSTAQANEYVTELDFTSVDAVCPDGEFTYVAADGKLVLYRNGQLNGAPTSTEGCDAQRFEPPYLGQQSWYLHCASEEDGTPRYFYSDRLLSLPDGDPYCPAKNNSIISKAMDADWEDVVIMVVIDRDRMHLRVYDISTISTFRNLLDLSEFCDEIRDIYYQPPQDGRLRFAIACIEDGELKHYAVKLRDDFSVESSDRLLNPGTVLSFVASGNHLCAKDTSRLTCYNTNQPTRAPDILSFNGGDIDNAEFLDSSAGSFLLVEIDGAAQMIFPVSTDDIGEGVTLTGSLADCSDGCLPHLVVDGYLLLIRRDGDHYAAYFYDLNNLSTDPVFRGRTRFRPRVVLFEAQEAPPTTEPVTSIAPQTTSILSPSTPYIIPSPSQQTTPTTAKPSSSPFPPPSPPNILPQILGPVLPFVAIVIGGLVVAAVLVPIIAAKRRKCKRKRGSSSPGDFPLKPTQKPPLQENDPKSKGVVHIYADNPSGYGSLNSSTSTFQERANGGSTSPDKLSYDSGTGSPPAKPLPFRDDPPPPPSPSPPTTMRYTQADTQIPATQETVQGKSELVSGK